MAFFRPKPPIDRGEYEWLVACFAWLRTVLMDAEIRPPLVLPNNPALNAAKTAPELFEAVRTLAGMENWPCRLEKVDDEVETGDMRITAEGSGACGTFSVENGEAIIRYSATMLRDPDALAATFAHELCHYLLMEAGGPPGGPDLMEHSTDLAAVYLGFGVLLANSARTFEQWQDDGWHGWRASSAGYLSEQALVTGTAMFAGLHGYGIAEAEEQLKPYLTTDLRKARKAVAHDYPDFSAAMAAVDLLDWRFD